MADHPIAAVITHELDLRAGRRMPLPDAQVRQFASLAREIDLRAGATLYTAGAPSEKIYLITQGELELRGPNGVWRATSGTPIGVLDSTSRKPYSRTAVARVDSRVLEFDALDYDEFLQDDVGAANHIIAQFAEDLVQGALATSALQALFATPPRTPAPAPAPVATTELTVIERVILLRRVPALHAASVQSLANLAEQARLVRLGADEIVVAAGATSDVISIVIEGELELTHPELGRIATRGPIELAAYAAELSIAPRSFTTIARVDSALLQIDREELIDRFEEHFELVRSIFAYLAVHRGRLNDARAAQGVVI